MLDPLASSRWNPKTAAHLLNRAGFGGTPEEIEACASLGLDAAVDRLVRFESTPDETAPPSWARPMAPEEIEQMRQLRRLPEEERQMRLREVRQKAREQFLDLRNWWLARMTSGPRPLQEKMTLFWHGHFATSLTKVRDPYLMWRQNEIFRRHAAGSWPELLVEVAKDPAMLIWLDGAQSNKNQPNENFAREVMELFTLGEGHYTEEDIREAARAFTGWSLGKGRQEFQQRRRLHDDGPKTFFGRTGKWKGEDILRIILEQPQSNRFITAKIWRFFTDQAPSESLAAALAAEFSAAGQNFAPLLGKILRSREFYAPSVMRNQIKSPVQWLVGTVRLLGRPLPPPQVSSNMLAQLGQDLFNPPNVKGWDGGAAWITTANLLARYNFAANLLDGRGDKPRPNRREFLMAMMEGSSGDGSNMEAIPPQERLRKRGLAAGVARMEPAPVDKLFTKAELASADALIAAMEQRFLQGQSLPARRAQPLREYLATRMPPRPSAETLRHAVRLLLSTPDYQVI